jgi:hypothetical protein
MPYDAEEAVLRDRLIRLDIAAIPKAVGWAQIPAALSKPDPEVEGTRAIITQTSVV